MRDPDAFQPSSDNTRASVGSDSGEILDPKFKGTNALKRKINPTRVPVEEKESYRWLKNLRQSTALLQCPERCVHIGDRESDIYELYCLASELNTYFLVRTCVNRLAENTTPEEEIKNTSPESPGQHRICLRQENDGVREVILNVSWKQLTLHPPIGKAKQYPDLLLMTIITTENEPNKATRIEWKLLTDLSITSLAEAVEKQEWYGHRGKIETFHTVMKSGCQAERSRPGFSSTVDKFIMLLLYSELADILADNAKQGNTQPAGGTGVLRNGNENTGCDGKKYNTNHIVITSRKTHDKTWPVGRVHGK